MPLRSVQVALVPHPGSENPSVAPSVSVDAPENELVEPVTTKSLCSVKAPVECCLIWLLFQFSDIDSVLAVSAESAAPVYVKCELAVDDSAAGVIEVTAACWVNRLLPPIWNSSIPELELITIAPPPGTIKLSCPFSLLERVNGELEAESVAVIVAATPVAAPFIATPVTTLAVLSSTAKTGFVAPFAPTISDVALADVMVWAAVAAVPVRLIDVW